jgi:hypothetical protein
MLGNPDVAFSKSGTNIQPEALVPFYWRLGRPKRPRLAQPHGPERALQQSNPQCEHAAILAQNLPQIIFKSANTTTEPVSDLSVVVSPTWQTVNSGSAPDETTSNQVYAFNFKYERGRDGLSLDANGPQQRPMI